MEIWVFPDYASIMPHSIINTTLQTDSENSLDSESEALGGTSNTGTDN